MKLISKPLVAVGIDPGTTLGYAILGLDGRVFRVGSERGGSLQRLIEESTYYGIPVIAATDEAKCPELVYRFSAKTGARIVAPPADLLSTEKRALLGDTEAGNTHELDAAAAARFALRKYSGILGKAEAFLKEAKKERYSDEVKRLLIQSDNIGVNEAVRIVEEREKKMAEPGKRQVAEEEQFTPSREDYLLLRERFRRLDEEYRTLRQSQEALLEELDKAGGAEEDDNSDTRPGKRKLSWLMRLKSKRIRELSRRVRIEEEKNLALERMISELGPKLLAKKLDNLTYDELLRKDKALKINQGDILLVEDVNTHSKRTLEALKGRVGIIIYRGRITSDVKQSRDFIFLDASKLRISEVDNFALVDRQELERVRKESSGFIDMFESYRESRKKGY